jgi:hypothetical protein
LIPSPPTLSAIALLDGLLAAAARLAGVAGDRQPHRTFGRCSPLSAVHEGEVVRVLKEARVGRVLGLVLLADRQLRQLPELFGRTCGLFVLDVLHNAVS